MKQIGEFIEGDRGSLQFRVTSIDVIAAHTNGGILLLILKGWKKEMKKKREGSDEEMGMDKVLRNRTKLCGNRSDER